MIIWYVWQTDQNLSPDQWVSELNRFSLFCEQIIQTFCAKWIKCFTEHTKMCHWKSCLDCHMTLEDLRPLHTESEIFACVFPFFRILHPFLSKCMQRMRKRRKSNLIQIFFDGRKFRRQCANVIDTTWGRIYFLTCENFRLSVQWPLEDKHIP